MINHEYLELFNQSSIKKDIDMAYDTDSHITNSDVVSGSFNLNESAFATKELRFGSLVSSQLSVKLYNTVPNLMDKQLDVSIVVDNITSNPLKIGKYKVLEDKPTTDRLYKQIKAYDGLYEVINKDVSAWYESLTFPMTLKAFRDSFFSYIGITQVAASLVNDAMQVEKTITSNFISGQQILSAICELNGAIGRINRDGNFVYVVLKAKPTTRITIDKIQSKSGSYEDYVAQPISKVQIRQTIDDIGAIVGNDGNTYIVQDNFLVYGKSSTDLNSIASKLLSVIKDISYTPFNIKAIYGNPCYEIGDAITVVTKNKTFNSYIFNRTLKGIQAMTDTIKADGVEYYIENLNSANVQMQQLKRQTNELSRTVEETKSTITSIETVASNASNLAEQANQTATNANTTANQANTKADDIAEDLDKNYSTTVEMQSQIKQSADSITSTVSKTYATQESVSQSVNNLQQQIDGAIETFTGSSVPTLSNSPAKDWTTTAIKDTHIGDLYIVNSSGGDYAGFYYRFEKSGSTYQWVLLKDNEVTKALQDAKEANDKAQAVANNLSTNYSTTAQMNSAISQSANSITSTVSATYTTKEEFNNLEIGGRNLIINSSQFRENTPLTNTTSSTDGYMLLPLSVYMPCVPGETYTFQCKTDGIWGDHTTDGTGGGCTHLYLYLQTADKIGSASFNTVKKFPSSEYYGKTGLCTFTYTIPTDYEYERIVFRTDIHSDGSTSYTVNWWDFKAEKGNKATDWTPAPEDTEASIAYQKSGLGMKVNYSAFTGVNDGEVYLCAKDPDTNALSNASGWVWWNGVKRGVPLTYMNPNTACPYYLTIYIVGRLSSASATNLATTDLYHVWYDGGWKYAAREASSVLGTWTWVEATDIVLGSFIEPASEAALIDAQLFNPPKTSAMVTSATSIGKTAANALSTANTANSKATTNATNITALTTRVTNAESSITQTATQIRSEVSATYTTKAEFNNMQVGGRNLVIGSATYNFRYYQMSPYVGTLTVVDDSDAISKKHIEVKCTTAGTGFYSKPYICKAGTTYTYSFWAKCSVAKSGTNFGFENGGKMALNLTTEWQYYTHTFKATDYQYTAFINYLNWNVDEIFYIRDFKLEEGTKATTWTPAPEDIETRVTAAESSITQNANNIALKVSKGDVSSQLSVESEQVTISGNRLVVDADNFQLTAEGSVTCDDMTITGGSMDVTGDNYQSKVIVRTEDSASQTYISPRQLVVSQESGKFVQLNSDMTSGYYGVMISDGSYITSINPALIEVGKSGSTSKYFSSDSSVTYSKARIITAGELQSTTANGLRIVQGNYGFFIRNDGSSTYFLLTASGDQYGTYNSLRPLSINDSTGLVTLGNGLSTTSISASGTISANYLKAGPSNGTAIRLIKSGSTVLTPGSTSSTGVKLFAHSTVTGWYSAATASTTAILVTNGDGGANGVHIEGVTYQNSDASWYIVCDSAVGSNVRVNYTVICW